MSELELYDPEPGETCQYKERGGVNWFNCVVIARHGTKVWLNNLDAGSQPLKPAVSVMFRRRPAPSAEEVKAAFEVFKTMWPNSGASKSIEVFKKNIKLDHSCHRLVAAGYRKLPSRAAAEQAFAEAWYDGEFGTTTATDKEVELLRKAKNIMLDVFLGEDNV